MNMCTLSAATFPEKIKAHVFAAERIHGDDTTVPVLAKAKTRTGRIWTYVRDDRPFGGEAPPAAVFFYSPDRASVHPERHLAGYSGILQADAYAGFNKLYQPNRKPGPITEAGCWAHARRKLFELADIAAKARNQKPTTISSIAFEAVQRFDAIFGLERSINGLSPAARAAVRRKDIAPLVNDLVDWMKRERGKLSRHNEVAKAFDYMLKDGTHLRKRLSCAPASSMCSGRRRARRAAGWCAPSASYGRASRSAYRISPTTSWLRSR